MALVSLEDFIHEATCVFETVSKFQKYLYLLREEVVSAWTSGVKIGDVDCMKVRWCAVNKTTITGDSTIQK